MSDRPDLGTGPSPTTVYEIRIQSHLDPRWTDWFAGASVTLEENGDTLMTGPVVDQAALHGLLKKVRDLGLPLLSVMRVPSGHAAAPDAQPQGQAKHGWEDHCL